MKAILLLTLLVTACGQDQGSNGDSAKNTAAPATEPTDTAKTSTDTTTATDVQETKETVDATEPTKLVDAEGKEIGALKDAAVLIHNVTIKYSAATGLVPAEKAPTCFYKSEDCTGTCYTLGSEKLIVIAEDQILFTPKNQDKDISLSAAGIDLPWKSERNGPECKDSLPSKSKAAEKYLAAELTQFKLPFKAQ